MLHLVSMLYYCIIDCKFGYTILIPGKRFFTHCMHLGICFLKLQFILNPCIRRICYICRVDHNQSKIKVVRILRQVEVCYSCDIMLFFQAKEISKTIVAKDKTGCWNSLKKDKTSKNPLKEQIQSNSNTVKVTAKCSKSSATFNPKENYPKLSKTI